MPAGEFPATFRAKSTVSAQALFESKTKNQLRRGSLFIPRRRNGGKGSCWIAVSRLQQSCVKSRANLSWWQLGCRVFCTRLCIAARDRDLVEKIEGGRRELL